MDQATLSQQTVTEQASVNRAKNKLGLYILIGIALVALVVVLTSVTGTRADFSSLRKHNVPTDQKELKLAFPQKGENAAPLYDAGLDKLSAMDQRGRETRSRHAAISSVVYYGDYGHGLASELAASAEQSKDIADVLSRGASADRCVYLQPLQVMQTADNRYNRPVYGYVALSEVEQFLGGMAIVSLMNGKHDEGIRYLSEAKNIVGQLSRNPGSESFNAWRDSADTYFRSWSSFAKLAANDPRIMDWLVPESSSLPMANIKQMAAGDFPENLAIYHKAQNDPGDYKLQMMRSFDDKITDFKPFMRQGVSEVIHEWRNVFESLADSSDDWRASKEVFQDASDDFQSRFPAKDVLINPFKEYVQRCDSYGYVLAEARVMATASKILAVREKTGRTPDELLDDGMNSIDPCTGKPLVYYKEGKGFKLYSVGPDGIDSSLATDQRRNQQDDIVFELVDPTMRPSIPMTPDLQRLEMEAFYRDRTARMKAAHLRTHS